MNDYRDRKRERERVERHAEGGDRGREGRIIVLHVYCASVAAAEADAVIDRGRRGREEKGGKKVPNYVNLVGRLCVCASLRWPVNNKTLATWAAYETEFVTSQ